MTRNNIAFDKMLLGRLIEWHSAEWYIVKCHKLEWHEAEWHSAGMIYSRMTLNRITWGRMPINSITRGRMALIRRITKTIMWHVLSTVLLSAKVYELFFWVTSWPNAKAPFRKCQYHSSKKKNPKIQSGLYGTSVRTTFRMMTFSIKCFAEWR
jgi:hypothetical protein